MITKTKNIERMRVKANGRVSIGGVTTPLAELDVFFNTILDTEFAVSPEVCPPRISQLVHSTENFATNALCLRFAIAQHTLVR